MNEYTHYQKNAAWYVASILKIFDAAHTRCRVLFTTGTCTLDASLFVVSMGSFHLPCLMSAAEGIKSLLRNLHGKNGHGLGFVSFLNPISQA